MAALVVEGIVFIRMLYAIALTLDLLIIQVMHVQGTRGDDRVAARSLNLLTIFLFLRIARRTRTILPRRAFLFMDCHVKHRLVTGCYLGHMAQN